MQASSASSERSFSKAGLIVAAKRMVMTPANVDRLSLVRWYMQRQGWDDRVMGKKKKPKFKGSSKAKTAQAHAKSKS